MAFFVGYFEVFATFTLLILCLSFLKRKKDPRYPPGPAALPIIGNVHQLGNKPQRVFLKWAREFGAAYSIKMGTEDVIVLNDAKLIKEVFQQAAASGRTHNPVFVALSGGNYGIIMSEGAHWEAQRRFALRKLRDSGFAKTSMEGLILDEVKSMNKWFENRLDKPINGCRIFNGAVVNALWGIMSGERHDWNTSEQPAMIKYTEDMIDSFNLMNATGLMFAPILRFIAPKLLGWSDWLRSIDGLAKTSMDSVKRHERKLNLENPLDLIDHYLVEMRNNNDPTSSFYKEVGDKNLVATIADLFLAGSETTSHTLSWALLLLSHNQFVQQNLHKELDNVLGRDRPPSVGDRPNLPYTHATVLEVLRRTAISTTGVPHRILNDTVIQGYFFPKNVTIMSNLYYVNNDINVWKDPENFRPERFLSDDGRSIIKHEAFMPFSVGKRVCLGEGLARDTLFLFLAGVLQKFHIKPDPEGMTLAINNIEPSSKMLNEPEPFNVVISKR